MLRWIGIANRTLRDGIFLLLLLSGPACGRHGNVAPSAAEPGLSVTARQSVARQPSRPVTLERAQLAATPPVPVPTPSASYAPLFTQRALIYYLPNRILDFVDIFRFDLGLGVSYGGVIRLTKYVPMGYRGFSPASMRFGLHGRHRPVFTERKSEYGFGSDFVTNRPRSQTVTPGEIGLGLDLLLIGAYVGIAFDELLDFVAGIVFIDFEGDDLSNR